MDIFTGNNDKFSKPYSPEVVRFFMLKPITQVYWTSARRALDASEKGYQKLMDAVNLVSKINPGKKAGAFNHEQWLKNVCCNER